MKLSVCVMQAAELMQRGRLDTPSLHHVGRAAFRSQVRSSQSQVQLVALMSAIQMLSCSAWTPHTVHGTTLR